MLPEPQARFGTAASSGSQGYFPPLGDTELLKDRQAEAAASRFHAA